LFIQCWGRRGAGCDRNADLQEESFISSGRADADHAGRRGRGGVKPVWRVGWNIERVAGARSGFIPSKGKLDFAIEQKECFFEVVAMWAWAAAWGHVHVDDTE